MKLLNNIFARDLELQYTNFFTIYILLVAVVTIDCTYTHQISNFDPLTAIRYFSFYMTIQC